MGLLGVPPRILQSSGPDSNGRPPLDPTSGSRTAVLYPLSYPSKSTSDREGFEPSTLPAVTRHALPTELSVQGPGSPGWIRTTDLCRLQPYGLVRQRSTAELRENIPGDGLEPPTSNPARLRGQGWTLYQLSYPRTLTSREAGCSAAAAPPSRQAGGRRWPSTDPRVCRPLPGSHGAECPPP